jgi:hypothetical protein
VLQRSPNVLLGLDEHRRDLSSAKLLRIAFLAATRADIGRAPDKSRLASATTSRFIPPVKRQWPPVQLSMYCMTWSKKR